MENLDWTMLIAIASVIVTNLITIITLYVHLDNKTENRLQKMSELMDGWRRISEAEMRDFHGKLCSIEERNKR